MKNAIAFGAVVALILMVIGIAPIYADDIFENTTLGAKVDMPNLVLQKGDHSVGAEISITDITEDWDLGSQAFVKYTYSGCFGLCDK